MVMIAVATLNEDGCVGQTLGVNLSAYIIQMYPFPYMASSVFYCRISVDIAKLTETESVAVIRGICEAIDDDRMRVAVKYLTDSAV